MRLKDPRKKRLTEYRRKGKCNCWMCSAGVPISSIRREMDARDQIEDYSAGNLPSPRGEAVPVGNETDDDQAAPKEAEKDVEGVSCLDWHDACNCSITLGFLL